MDNIYNLRVVGEAEIVGDCSSVCKLLYDRTDRLHRVGHVHRTVNNVVRVAGSIFVNEELLLEVQTQ